MAGKFPTDVLGEKREAELPSEDPDYALPVYQGKPGNRAPKAKPNKKSPMAEAMKKRLDREG